MKLKSVVGKFGLKIESFWLIKTAFKSFQLRSVLSNFNLHLYFSLKTLYLINPDFFLVDSSSCNDNMIFDIAHCIFSFCKIRKFCHLSPFFSLGMPRFHVWRIVAPWSVATTNWNENFGSCCFHGSIWGHLIHDVTILVDFLRTISPTQSRVMLFGALKIDPNLYYVGWICVNHQLLPWYEIFLLLPWLDIFACMSWWVHPFQFLDRMQLDESKEVESIP